MTNNFYYDDLILVDCDGVLLNWNYGFERWMYKIHGLNIINPNEYNAAKKYEVSEEDGKMFVKLFNGSMHAGYLSPFKDSVKYLRKLHQEHGKIFKVISSFSLDPLAQKMRIQNLKRHFGEGIFESYSFQGLGQSKFEDLSEYSNSGIDWIDDHSTNYELGLELGLNSFLMDHAYNKDTLAGDRRIMNWKDYYNLNYG